MTSKKMRQHFAQWKQWTATEAVFAYGEDDTSCKVREGLDSEKQSQSKQRHMETREIGAR